MTVIDNPEVSSRIWQLLSLLKQVMSRCTYTEPTVSHIDDITLDSLYYIAY